MKRKGQLTTLEVVLFCVISVVAVLSLFFIVIKPYQAGVDIVKSEAARFTAMNIAGALGLMNTNADAEYTFTVDLPDCEIWILPNSVIVNSQKQSGTAYVADIQRTTIVAKKITCTTNKVTKIIFKKQGNTITPYTESEVA